MSLERLRYLSDVMPANCVLIYSNRHNILEQIKTADLVVGAVLIPGAKAPKLVRREDLKTMQPGAVIVDVAIDQGGCVETIHATTHENPTYVVDGIIHYGVANMPGGVPRTSTLALTNATLPYAMQLASKGWKQALRENPALLKGLNMTDGHLTYPGVAEAFGMSHEDPATFSSDGRHASIVDSVSSDASICCSDSVDLLGSLLFARPVRDAAPSVGSKHDFPRRNALALQ